jgi:tetratricopeptide (TPR) repeat protein
MRTKLGTLGQGIASVAILALTGAITAPLTQMESNELPSSPKSELHRSLAGGFSGLMADFSWIGAYQSWAKRDIRGMRADLDRVVSFNPQAIHFWINGARMLSYDVAAWRTENLPKEERVMVNREQVKEALMFLDQGKAVNPGRFEFALEEAIILLRLGSDTEGALAALESVEGMENLPEYIGRIRGELLVSLGRFDEAETWLNQFLATLPDAEKKTGKGLVRQRIEELERARQEIKTDHLHL